MSPAGDVATCGYLSGTWQAPAAGIKLEELPSSIMVPSTFPVHLVLEIVMCVFFWGGGGGLGMGVCVCVCVCVRERERERERERAWY